MSLTSVNQYRLPPPGGDEELRYTDYRSDDPLSVVVLGGCMSQYAADALRHIGHHNGIKLRSAASWPTNLEILNQLRPDFVALQFSTTWALGPLWDRIEFFDDSARADMLDSVKASCASSIRQALEKVPESLLLVHGFSRPMISPLGIHDFRYQYHFDRVIFELNEHIRSLIRDELNAMYLDEERIFANSGKAALLDHMIAPFSHHGPIGMVMGPPVSPSREETFGITQPYGLAYLLAKEYLDHYIAWKGVGRIKSIVVDLDHVLWPLTVGESGFDLNAPVLYQSLRFGVWAGIHQALKLLKKRGVLLATASRNSRDFTLSEWKRLAAWCDDSDLDHVLRPDDFVLHEINWGAKSASISRILSALEMTDGEALFIDDSPAERAEVKAHHANLQIVGENLNLVRQWLLTNPRLQFNHLNAEAEQRTEMVKGQLLREESRQTTPDSSAKNFLQSLDIELRVRKLASDDSLNRCVELLQRTNQFNITLRRRSVGTLRQLMSEADTGLFVFEVKDKFCAYGTVGVCIIRGNEVTDFSMSCRVIGLQPEVPFLRASLLAHGKSSYRGSIIVGPRNHPCRALFANAGFSRLHGDEWELADLSALTPVDPDIYKTTVQGEPRAEP